MSEIKKRRADKHHFKILKRAYLFLIIIILLLGVLLVFHQQIIDRIIVPIKFENNLSEVDKLTEEDYRHNNKRFNKVDISNNKDYEFNNNRAQNVSQIEGMPVIYDFSSVKPINLLDVKDMTFNKKYVTGQICIPSVGLRLPILEGLSNNNLWNGASTMKSNQIMGEKNYCLAGHTMPNKSSLFSPIHQIVLNSNIYITDGSVIYVYKVYSKKVINPTKSEILNDTNEPIITLVTCNDVKGHKRLIIQGKLIKKINRYDANNDLLALFNF